MPTDNIISLDPRFTPLAAIERLNAYATGGEPPDMNLLSYDLAMMTVS